MVLQQQSAAAFWGEASPGTDIKIEGSWGDEISGTSNTDGTWMLNLQTPDAGGPFTVSLSTRDTAITISDVLIGEVWVASGQSNMQMPLKGWPPNDPIQNSAEEISNADFPFIRMFTVTRKYSVTPLKELEGSWEVTTPENSEDFSASAYFFARRLHNELGVPIGIIHSSWGGTVAEAWTSGESLRAMGDFDETLDLIEDSDIQEKAANWLANWYRVPFPDSEESWANAVFGDQQAREKEFDDSDWSEIELPGRFDVVGSGFVDGAIWLRKSFELENADGEFTLKIGAVDDMDATYINGQEIGSMLGPGKWNLAREYIIPEGVLVNGTNTIAIRAIDTGGPGTVNPTFELTGSSTTTSLEGLWKTKIVAEILSGQIHVYGLSADLSERPNIAQLHPNLPTVLHNAMITPLVPYTIKGAIWYQGESNVSRAKQYETLFPTMIEDWRAKWGYTFPFYYVQIAPFLYNPDPALQQSAALRDAQRKSLTTEQTGMVVTLDIGNARNIHPANKQDVGSRLAGLALSNDYDKEIVSSGPLVSDIEKEGTTITLSFAHTGSGLKAGDSGLVGFEISDSEGNYHPADAEIVDNKVVVTSPQVSDPQGVRYAWRDDSEASLFNEEGLPASSFSIGN